MDNQESPKRATAQPLASYLPGKWSEPPRALLLKIGAFLLLPVLAALLFFVIQLIDDRSRVVTGFSVVSQKIEEGGVMISGTLNKARSCQLIEVTARTADGLVSSVAFLSRGNLHPAFSAPPGPQRFGPWFIDAKPGDGVTLFSVHRCHFFWPHYDVLGTFVVTAQ
jgi:hypothetical protein